MQTVDEHERTHRDLLTQTEITRLQTSAKSGRFGTRDHAMLLLAFRHGLRVSKLTSVRITDIDLDAGRIWVKRVKEGLSTMQLLQGDALLRYAHISGRERTPCRGCSSAPKAFR